MESEEKSIVLLPYSSGAFIMDDTNFWAVPFPIIFEIKIKQSDFQQDKDGYFFAPLIIKKQQCYLFLYAIDFRRVFGLSKRKTIVKETIGHLQSFKDFGEEYGDKNKNFKFTTSENKNYTFNSIYVQVFPDENSDQYKYQLALVKSYLNKGYEKSLFIASLASEYLGLKEFENIVDLKE